MAEILTLVETTARAITDDLTKQNNQAQEEQTDAVKNLQIKFNEQQVKSKKAQDKDDPDKTTGQMKQRSIHSTCIRTNKNCETENTMATQTERNQPRKESEIQQLYEGIQQHQREMQLQKVEMQQLQQQHQREMQLQKAAMQQFQHQHQQELKLHTVAMQKVQQQHDRETNKQNEDVQALQQQVKSLGTTLDITTNLNTVDKTRTQRQQNVAHDQTRSQSQTTTGSQHDQPTTSVVTTKYDNPTNEITVWEQPSDGIIQSSRGATATLSRNLFDTLYITEDTKHRAPTLAIRNELLEYQRRKLTTRPGHTTNGQSWTNQNKYTAQTKPTNNTITTTIQNTRHSSSNTSSTDKNFNTRKRSGNPARTPTQGYTHEAETVSDIKETHHSINATRTSVPTLLPTTTRSTRNTPQANTWNVAPATRATQHENNKDQRFQDTTDEEALSGTTAR
jgi:hypothetical protein